MTLIDLVKKGIDERLKEIEKEITDSSVDVISAYEFLQYHLLKEIGKEIGGEKDDRYNERVRTIMHLQGENKTLCSKVSKIYALCVNNTAQYNHFLDHIVNFEYSDLKLEDKKELVLYALNKTDEAIKDVTSDKKEKSVFKDFYNSEELSKLKESFQKLPDVTFNAQSAERLLHQEQIKGS